MALNVLKSSLVGFGAILGVSSAHTLVDEIQYLFAHSLLTQSSSVGTRPSLDLVPPQASALWRGLHCRLTRLLN